MIQFLDYYRHKGHVFGECMTHTDTNLMYVYIPKNASSWAKPNFLDFNWQYYNYHTDNLYNKHAIIVLRDPVDRWLSGIGEYMSLYHPNFTVTHFSKPLFDIIFDRVAFDDHTERQSLFLNGLDLNNCTFFLCDHDFRNQFSSFLNRNGMPNKFFNYEYQNKSIDNKIKQKFKKIFQKAIEENSNYMSNLKKYFFHDYQLINSVKFYAG